MSTILLISFIVNLIFSAFLIIIYTQLRKKEKKIISDESKKFPLPILPIQVNFDEDFKFLNELINNAIAHKVYFKLKIAPTVNSKGQEYTTTDEQVDTETTTTVQGILNTISEFYLKRLLFYFVDKEELIKYLLVIVLGKFVELYKKNNYKIIAGKTNEEEEEKEKK